MVGFSPEESEFERAGSSCRRFMGLSAAAGANLAVLFVTDKDAMGSARIEEDIRKAFKGDAVGLHVIVVRVSMVGDPFGLKQQVAAKMILNAHSTAVMAKLGKVVGNTMTNVSPSNLKLIGRATYLIQSHVNDVLGRAGWAKAYGRRNPITYAEANAVLSDSIAYLKDRQNVAGQTAEVALSIIRILESIRQRRGIGRDEALRIVNTAGLAAYLASR
jgi:hypothetical protein